MTQFKKGDTISYTGYGGAKVQTSVLDVEETSLGRVYLRTAVGIPVLAELCTLEKSCQNAPAATQQN